MEEPSIIKMSLKHRVKQIEKTIVPRQEARVWIIDDPYCGKKNDLDGKQRVENKIQEIKDGKKKNRDGDFHREGDTFTILSRIFSPRASEETKADEAKIAELQKEKVSLQKQLREKKEKVK